MRLDEKSGSVGLAGGARDLTAWPLGEKPPESAPGASKVDPAGTAFPDPAPGSTAPFRTVRADRFYQVPPREPRPADPGAAVLVVPSPLMALVALAVKADGTGGPVLFRQVRVGKGGKEFEMYKFRTMVPDAEERLGEHGALNEKEGPVFKIRDDPRVTRVGRLLRRTSLAPVIIGTPDDGEPTKSFLHPANSPFDLQLCERRPGAILGARRHYASFQFLSFAVFRSSEGVSGRLLCTRAQALFASVGMAA